MTTTHTFQGLNTDGKPSSRVLNPPGGSSSNIFGGDESQQRTPVRNNPANVNRSSNDVFGQGHNTAAVVPQQKSRPPRSGDDSFHTLFGNCQTSGASDKASNSSRLTSPVTGVQNQRFEYGQGSSRVHQKSPNTFLTIFGRENEERRKMFRSVKDNNDDSFSRLFGQSTSSTPALSVSAVRSSGTSLVSSPSHSKLSNFVSTIDSIENKDVISPSFSPVSGMNMTLDRRHTRQRRFSDRGAFNPITGEAYEQPKAKQEAPAQVNSAPSQNDAMSVEAHEVPILASDSDQEKPQPIPKPVSVPVAPVPVCAPVTDQKKLQQSGVFGGSEEVKEVRSTRVSQPPGGRSTKLW